MTGASLKVSDLPELDIESPGFATNADDADAFIAGFWTEHEIARSQRGVEILGYDALSEILRHPEFAEDHHAARITGVEITEGPVFAGIVNLLDNIDGPDHKRMRKVVTPWFSKSGAERFRAWATNQLRELDADCDFVTIMGTYLPAVAVCKTLGMSLDDAGFIARVSVAFVRPLNSALTPDNKLSVEAAAVRGWDHLERLIAKRRDEPGDDLISVMLEAEKRGEMTEREILNVGMTVLVASTDVTGGQIALNMLTLADHPDQWQVLKDGGDDLIPGAVLD